MSETNETEAGTAKTRGPRTFKPGATPRQRVLSESLAKFIKKNTGVDVSWRTVWAVRWSLSRWAEDPETKQLRDDMDENLKLAKLKERREKAMAILAETDSEFKELQQAAGEASEDEESDEDYDGEDEANDDDDDDDDLFAESDSSVSSQFS